MRTSSEWQFHKLIKTLFIYLAVGLFVVLTVFNLSGCRNSSEKQGKITFTTFTDGNGFVFDLPDVCEIRSEEDLDSMRQKDPSLIFEALTGLPFTGSTIRLSVFSFPREIPVDSPFMEIVRYVPVPYDGDTLFSYRLIDYGSRSVDGKTLRYKISCVDSTDYYILYYFMKNDKSDTLYELKSTCYSENEIVRARDFLELIALSVRFTDEEADSLQFQNVPGIIKSN